MFPLDTKTWDKWIIDYEIDPDIPVKLTRLFNDRGKRKAFASTWVSGDFWGTLCHQDTVYAMTYAVVPYIVHILQLTIEDKNIRETRAEMLYFVGTCAAAANTPGSDRIPRRLQRQWKQALKRTKPLIAEMLSHEFDEPLTRHLLAALASLSGYTGLYYVIDNLDVAIQCPKCETCFEPMQSNLNLEFGS